MAIPVKYLAPYNGSAAFSTEATYTPNNSHAAFIRRDNPRVRGFGAPKSGGRKTKRGMR